MISIATSITDIITAIVASVISAFIHIPQADGISIGLIVGVGGFADSGFKVGAGAVGSDVEREGVFGREVSGGDGAVEVVVAAHAVGFGNFFGGAGDVTDADFVNGARIIMIGA